MIKLIVWDLDGILWNGTLAEEGPGQINYKVIDFIKTTESTGIVHSICSKNNFHQTKEFLESLGIWDLFVFPSIDLTPKYQRVLSIIESCQLRAPNVLFVDDNTINTNEALFYIPEINVSNDVSFIDSFTYEKSKSRTNQYRILEQKSVDKNNIDFLKNSDINITITDEHGCIEFHDRIVELVNRSNTLNFTKSRMHVDFSEKNTGPYFHFNFPRQNYAVFVWDKYGYYGLVGFIGSDWDSNEVEHFVFSCRILNMGIENYCSKFIAEKLGWKQNYNIDTSGDYSYIKYNEYKDVKNFIREKENMPIPIDEPVACINAGCFSYILWMLTGIGHKLSYSQGVGLEQLATTEIEKYPNLIIYSLSFDLAPENFSNSNIEFILDCFDKFIKNVKFHNKKVLVILPYNFLSIISNKDPSILALYRSFEKQFDNTCFFPLYVKPDNSDYRHYNRNKLYQLAQSIKIWVENPLQYTTTVVS
jgi:FkbH-like protein